jgi:hypothetical protein
VGKSYRDRGDRYPKPVGGSEDDEEFDYNEYLRQKAEEEDLEKETDERLEIEDSLADWHSMSDEEKEELRQSQKPKEQK